MAQRIAALHPRSVYVSSFVQALVFAYSASVQLNDDDWYFWLPLYSLASVVCLANMTRFTTTRRRLAYVGFVSGSTMFFKVFLEGYLEENFRWKDILSLDMNERLVRERFGSLLVCLSMWVSTGDAENSRKKAGKTGSKSRPGMLLLAVISICLSIAYFSGRN